MKKISILIISLVFVSFFTGCAPKEDSEKTAVIKAFNEFTSSLNQKKWTQVWEMLSSKSKKAFEKEGYKRMQEILEAMPPEIRKKRINSLGVTQNELLKMPPEKFFVFVMEKTQDSQEFASMPLSVEVSSVEIKENKAVLKLKDNLEKAIMVKEGEQWKMEFEED